MKKLLEVLNLKTYFFLEEGVGKAVDDVSFFINEGEIFGLVGESGCGKSVTALSIMRLVPSPGKIVGGKIIFEGENLLEKSYEEMRDIRGRKISMIFQEPMVVLNPVYSIGFQIAEAIVVHYPEVSWDEAWERAVYMIEKVGIPNPRRRAEEYPYQMSGGMRQRAMIAMALINNPRLLIADEPTTALDVTVQAQILELMERLKEEYKASILFITHDLSIIAEISHRVGVMYGGKIVEVGDVFSIFDRPLHPYTFGLLNSMPRLDKEEKRLYSIPGSVPSLLSFPQGCRFKDRCDKAFSLCDKEPPLVEVESGHFVQCWLFSK
ncbi:MAG: ABC transporter ATP-binding protein [Synergistetes bacterium]|nr:MAG: ABC-type dipeptide/oligopeptide/nickel transport system ATPase component [bacterium 42_11]MBC7331964.1 ABC transporter ATP-binding protein [Synergistota bacterium]MDK2871115.1 peptide/nickel transport system ATP-binding protein [bacterium]